MTRAEFWPSRLFLSISILVWIGVVALVVWGVSGLDVLGDQGRWIAAWGLGGALGLFGLLHVWGSQFAGPTLVADLNGMIFRDGRKVWGPIPWRQVTRIELGEPRPTIAVWIDGPITYRNVIGLGWVIESRRSAPEILWIEPHILDNRGKEAYAALTRLKERAS